MKSFFLRIPVRSRARGADPIGAGSPELETLESRLLFSAAPVDAPDAGDAAVESQEQAAEESVVVTETAAGNAATAVESAESDPAPEETGDSELGDSGPAVRLVNLNPGVEEVNRETLEALAEAATERWRATGLTDEQSAALDNITYHVADLRGNQLGQTVGLEITIDLNAASSFWFVDTTPYQDEEC